MIVDWNNGFIIWIVLLIIEVLFCSLNVLKFLLICSVMVGFNFNFMFDLIIIGFIILYVFIFVILIVEIWFVI